MKEALPNPPHIAKDAANAAPVATNAPSRGTILVAKFSHTPLDHYPSRVSYINPMTGTYTVRGFYTRKAALHHLKMVVDKCPMLVEVEFVG
jgi:hypothetical protein